MKEKIEKTEEEWKRELSPMQYQITREKGTEPPFSGTYVDFKKDGVYACVACGNVLFDSGSKYESGSGWPSFYSPVDRESIETARETSHGMIRTEILCSQCGSHIGHVFEDGPPPTGLRYCVNSVALHFIERK